MRARIKVYSDEGDVIFNKKVRSVPRKGEIITDGKYWHKVTKIIHPLWQRFTTIIIHTRQVQ